MGVHIQQHMKPENKFILDDLIRMHELMYSLRVSTQPLNDHTDPLSTNDIWNDLEDMLNKLGNTFKDQLVTKESIEKLIGKEVHTFEKVYDEKGMLKGVNVTPVQAVEYITTTFTITQSGVEI